MSAGVGSVGRRGGMAVAHQFRLAPVHGGVQQHGPAEVEAGFQLRHVQVRAASGGPLAVHGGQDGGDGELGTHEVGVRAVGVHRPAVGPADDVGVAGQGRQHRAESRLGLHGAAAPQHGRAEQHDARVDLAQLVVAQAPAFQGAGGEVLGDHVGPFRDAQDQLRRAGMAHVDGQAVLVGVVVGEVAGAVDARLSAGEGAGAAQRLRPLGRLHAQHRRPILRQVLGGHRAHGHPAEVENFQPFQRQTGHQLNSINGFSWIYRMHKMRNRILHILCIHEN